MNVSLDMPNFKFYVLSAKNIAPLKTVLAAEDSSLINVCYFSRERIY